MEMLSDGVPANNPSTALESIKRFASIAALAFLVVGGLNLALIAFFDVDLIASAFGAWSDGARWAHWTMGAAGAFSVWAAVPSSGAAQV